MWYYPPVVHWDKCLLEATRATRGDGDLGRSAQVALFSGTKAVIRKSDGTQARGVGCRRLIVVVIVATWLLVMIFGPRARTQWSARAMSRAYNRIKPPLHDT